jgi:N-acetylmuramoyl-L-alanine amidase
MNITDELLPYHSKLQQRDTSNLELVVLHCTELPTLEMAREYGERIMYPDSGVGVSGHYYIDRDGSIYRYVPVDRVAHHVIGHNQNSIGIEIVNTGRYPHWYRSDCQVPTEQYTAAQLLTLRELLKFLKEQYPSLNRIARHSDLDLTLLPAEDNNTVQIRRKIDPGPHFPWEEIESFWNDL